MAVITPGQLRTELGIAEIPAPHGEDAGDRTEREAINDRNMLLANRLHAVALAAVEGYAPGAADAVKSEALIRTAAYLHADGPAAKVLRRMQTADLTIEPRAPGSPLRLSGAAALLSPYRVRRAAAAAEVA